MDVGEWLRGLGLGQYEDSFRDNKIDADVLADLTDGDLEKLGLPLGDRKRYLRAIANLGSRELAPAGARFATAPPPPPSLPERPKSTEVSAERRPITVLFCDLVGSTGIAAKLDPEDWRNLVNTYLDDASAAITNLGGYAPRTIGDGLMALFGYPQAQENDAERAVRAGLAIQRALTDINAKNAGKGAPELTARIGIELGPVVIDATGEVFGDAPNVAARVQAAAEPGSVLVTANVQRQTAGLFVAEAQGERELKGVGAPVPLFRIVRASGAGRRRGARVLTPFVGREEELGLLARRWERARLGAGQLALIVGEPGIGKSRLIEEFRTRLAGQPHTWAEWSASQLLQNTPLHPIAEWGRQRFGGADVSAERRLTDLESALRQVKIDADEAASLLAPLLDIPLPPHRAATFAPEEMRRRQLAAIVSWVMAGARSQALVLVFEDLQWADPTSIDVMRALAERGAQAPILILATFRPEFRPSWGMRAHHGVVSLAPLERAEVRKMITELATRHALSRDVVEGVSERTGGVPLFVEEVTRLLLDRGQEGDAHAIPPTLQQSLAARLDRLGNAREIAQIGAVLGRDFSYALLQAVAAVDDRGAVTGVPDPGGGLSEAALQSALERLAEADILFVEGVAPQTTFRFKHALIQDAAYDSLLKSRRQTLHRRAAEVLRESGAEPEAVAHHFTESGLDDLAIEWWGKAGDQALRRSAFQEAIAHLGKAIAMADRAAGAANSTSETASSRRVKLQTDYAHAVLWSKGFAADETKAAFERTGDLASGADLPAERLSALYGRCTWNLLRGDMRAARDIAERFLEKAEADGRIAEAVVAHRLLGFAYMCLGGLAEARSHLELALNSYNREHGDGIRQNFGFDPRVASGAYLAQVSWFLGDLRRARRLIDEAIGLAGELRHLPSTIIALHQKLSIERLRSDPERAVADAENLLRISQQHGVEMYEPLSRVYLSWARGRLGDARRGADDLRYSLADYTSRGNRAGTPGFLGLLAELEAAAGNAERALAAIEEGLAAAHEGGEHWNDAFLHLTRGGILLKHVSADPTPAEDAYRRAIAIAKQQGARSYELIASLALAKLHHSIGRPGEARAVLAPALEGFSPTPEMREIAEAQALMARLA